eukprot:2843391-Rhodomonas_salina.1
MSRPDTNRCHELRAQVNKLPVKGLPYTELQELFLGPPGTLRPHPIPVCLPPSLFKSSLGSRPDQPAHRHPLQPTPCHVQTESSILGVIDFGKAWVVVVDLATILVFVLDFGAFAFDFGASAFGFGAAVFGFGAA